MDVGQLGSSQTAELAKPLQVLASVAKSLSVSSFDYGVLDKQKAKLKEV